MKCTMNADAYSECMREAIREALSAKGKTFPNPQVGAVLVRDGHIVARGHHTKAGAPHAEIECLADARKRGVNPADCVLVVTLEPCRHYGKTPPCTKAILEAGIKTVIIGTLDPTEEAGGGKAVLLNAGVNVLGPICEEACRDLVADFCAWKQKKRPYSILKMASTLDGHIAISEKKTDNRADSQTAVPQDIRENSRKDIRWISCEASRASVHELRARLGTMHGMILVGGKTYRVDNPQLTARQTDGTLYANQPFAGVVSATLPDAQQDSYLLTHRPTETIFFTSEASADSRNADALRARGLRIIPLPTQPHSTALDLTTLFHKAFNQLSIPYVLCEGGGQLAKSLLAKQLVDEFHLHIAPLILANNDAPSLFPGCPPWSTNDAIQLRCTETRRCGEDVHLLFRPLQKN